MKAKRNHKKRHGVNRERSLYDRRRHARAVYRQSIARAELIYWHAINRLYWSGEVDDFTEARAIVKPPTKALRSRPEPAT